MSRHNAGPLLEQRSGINVPAARAWLDLLDLTMRWCSAHGRSDLAEALQGKRAQLLSGRVRVLVTGEPRRGKSSLVNALLNAEVCPVGDGPVTQPRTLVRHAREPKTTTLDNDVEVGIPRTLLAEGMEIVDTPGIYEPGKLQHVVASTGADLAIFVTDAARPLVPSEINLLKTLARTHGGGGIILALTKIDLSSRWRAVLKANRRLVSEAGVSASLVPVSAELRLRAAATGDHGLNAESGFPRLVAQLRQREAGIRAGASAAARRAIEQLTVPLRAEVSTVDLRDAQRAVEELRRGTTRWQNTLSDEMADLVSDVEYDLRDRTRRILAAVDEAFDVHDPLADWNAFATWLSDNLEAAAEANFRWMILRCEAIADRVANHFRRYGYRLDALPYPALATPRAEVPLIEQPGLEGFSAVQKLFTGMRGSYGGILMFGLATSLAGMPLINPLSLGAGAIFGGKTVIDEGRMLLKRRQGAAKAGAQRHVDDFFLRFSKDGRDAARYIQRALRDHFTELTDELQEAIIQSFRRAQRGAEAIAAERSAQLRQLTALYERARST
ncbi:MAG TPA: dynamin family protein [Candidatus Limnocylindrales bacterium]|nr:dynamin family protein [Candidatus Limnocylindrales bacterium]